jgi:DNA invertase Pin-like site-specific DNA recombinase
MNTQKVNILYARLSRDDELQGPSNSILNQQQLLEEYANAHGLTPYIFLHDDGYSGTRWDRPSWQELISMVDADKVSCICIKDSSRMGRDYLRVGLYRELFREKGVRLILINDNVDTLLNSEDDFTPFREIMAEWYARDTSKKIKSVFAAKGRSGKPTTSTPPYGYMKDPNDKYKWVLDEPAAAVVRRIFQMAMEGMGVHHIAKALHDDKIERPSYYLGVRGRGRHKNDYDTNYKYSWGTATIKNILGKMQYAGYMVNLKYTSPSFKSKKKIVKPQEDWIIFPDAHPAIIDQETFDTVQKLRETPRRIDTLGEANPLTGLLWCADCGEKLYNHRKSKTEKPTHKKLRNDYHCKTYKLSNYKFDNKCSPHHISTEAVRTIILDVLKKTSGYIQNHEEEFVEQLRATSNIKREEIAKAHKKQIAKNEKRIADLDKIFRSLYEDKALEKITEEMFEEMTSGYTQEKEEIKTANEKLQAELDEFTADNDKAENFLALVRKYTSFEELTTPMLNSFVEKVIVHECEWSDGNTGIGGRPRGSRSQQVDVYLKYIGNFDVPDMRTPEEIEADRIAEEKLEAKRAYHRQKTQNWVDKKRAAEAEKAAAKKAKPETSKVKIAKPKTAKTA